MTYATLADMSERFQLEELVLLTDRDPAATAVDEGVLTKALEDADAEIELRLAARYAMPLSEVPRALVSLACDIARYRLHDDRAPDHVVKRYDAAIALLDKIGSGAVAISAAPAAVSAAAAGAAPQFTDPQRVFTRESLSDYAP